jgi:ATP-dependent DNA helicase RecG
MPPGRQRVDTFLVDEGYRARLDAFIKKNVDGGGQVYIVCPAVDEQEIEADEIELYDIALDRDYVLADEKPPLKAAVKYAEELSDRLEGYSVAFVHGKMKSSQKDKVMSEFAAGKIQILVSTTVIEVGVNVPTACLMIVENAERFGLSQLHQLRGRVVRGQKKSYCILVSGTEKLSSLGQNAKRRLETMCTSYNGFEIAEEDLKLRGPGDFLSLSGNSSIRQSGSLTFRLADMCEDADMMNTAFGAANEYLEYDPTLDEHPPLRDAAERMFTMRGDIIS